ncbi:hypothetical protein SAMN04487831_11249 [Pseudobutyrivibrio sp. UC1225]|uniref:hypothetical protein n=1 Tax=Pseudobutyrivibrio sp. UC1225 TaxID=1798185 RepID=UPI0008F0B096|nr:hypothetical protein [Pseudobutyrivibrio sp. UC1225]SFO21589.1 hypothetical protein SAMN04487831_11249 [Pseudobutyrivibrio sp. UC1225]
MINGDVVKNMKRSIPLNVVKELYAKSGNQCEFRGCNNQLVTNGINTSNICHIQGLEPGSARYNPQLTNAEANAIDNLILCCPNHHKIIDSGNFDVNQLLAMKYEHEQRIYNLLNEKAIKQEYLQVFNEHNFNVMDECFWTKPFELSIIDELDVGVKQLRIIAQHRKLRGESSVYNNIDIANFASNLEYFLTTLAINTHPSESCTFGVLKCCEDDRRAFDKLWRDIVREYQQLLD